MDTFMGRYRNVSILAAAVFIQVIGLAIQVKSKPSAGNGDRESSRLIRVWTVAAVTPLEKGIVKLQTGTSKLWHNYVYLRGVRQENRELKDRIERLQLEQVRLEQDATQARRLQSLLGFKEEFIDQTVAAQVIGSSGSEQSRTVFLDKGRHSGIKEGMPVISADGIVGKVILSESGTSQVLLINDQTSGVGTILENSRLQGVLKGQASGRLSLENIMSEEDVKVGERVLTSGGDQIFPKGLRVGTISDVKRGAEFLQVTVKPATALNHLEEVLVITRQQERVQQPVGTSPVRAADILAQRLPQVPDKPVEPSTGQTPPGAATAAPKSGIVPGQPSVPGNGTPSGANKPPQPRTQPVGASAGQSAPAKPAETPATATPQSQPGDAPQ